MTNKELVDTGEKYVKAKRGGGGKNSPVIGDNGCNLKDGDASKAAKTILFLAENDSYFGPTFSQIKTEADIRALAKTELDKGNVETMKKRFVGFVSFCMTNDIKFGNETAYMAIGISKDDVYNWEHGVSRGKEHCDLIKKVKGFCRSYRELLGAMGALNPVTLVWWQKNYDGLVDSQQIVVKPDNPLGPEPDQKALEERIMNSVIDVD